MSTDPICLVGVPRSGTTWMTRLMERRAEIALWSEPRQVWSFGHWFRPDERLEAKDASPRIVRHIRHRFFEYARRRGKPRFCEKTPSNVLRLPFVRAVLPEARIVLIVRDGRSILRSTSEIRERGADWSRIRTKILESRPLDLLSFTDRSVWILDKIRGKPLKYWGVRPPGWREWVASDAPEVAIAKAWAAGIRCAVTDGEAMDPAGFLQIRYEDMTEKPRETMQRVVDFLALADADDLVNQAIADADPDRQNKWRAGLSEEVLAAVRPHMEPTLEWLGYSW